MKLSKKNKSLLRNIRDLLASGKTLGGLLVSLAATTIGSGCHRDRGPHNVMGSYPNPNPDANVRNERRDCHVRGKYIVKPPAEKSTSDKSTAQQPSAGKERK